MTDKELRKLRRSELLEILIEQKKITAAAQKRTEEEKTRREEMESRLAEMDEAFKRLCKERDEKDEKIHELRASLEEQPVKADPESLARTSVRLNKALELIEKAVEKIQAKSS